MSGKIVLVDDADFRLNVASDGKRFRCDFIREGPVYYPEIGKGIECLPRFAIEDALDSFVGKPLVIEHIDPRLNVADPAVFAKHAHGKVDKVGRDPDSGLFFCEGEIFDDAGRKAGAELRPSCGYKVLATGPAGRWNNVPYERSLSKIEFHHLALTALRPRYEVADFRLNAVTNPTGEIIMFKFLRKFIPTGSPAGTAPVTEEVEVSPDTVIKIGDKEVRLNSCIEAFQAASAESPEAKKIREDAEAAERARLNAAAINDETEVLVAGKPVKVSVLRAAYESRENAATAAAASKAAEAARGAADFNKLQAAASGAGGTSKLPAITTVVDDLKRGNY